MVDPQVVVYPESQSAPGVVYPFVFVEAGAVKNQIYRWIPELQWYCDLALASEKELQTSSMLCAQFYHEITDLIFVKLLNEPESFPPAATREILNKVEDHEKVARLFDLVLPETLSTCVISAAVQEFKLSSFASNTTYIEKMRHILDNIQIKTPFQSIKRPELFVTPEKKVAPKRKASIVSGDALSFAKKPSSPSESELPLSLSPSPQMLQQKPFQGVELLVTRINGDVLSVTQMADTKKTLVEQLRPVTPDDQVSIGIIIQTLLKLIPDRQKKGLPTNCAFRLDLIRAVTTQLCAESPLFATSFILKIKQMGEGLGRNHPVVELANRLLDLHYKPYAMNFLIAIAQSTPKMSVTEVFEPHLRPHWIEHLLFFPSLKANFSKLKDTIQLVGIRAIHAHLSPTLIKVRTTKLPERGLYLNFVIELANVLSLDQKSIPNDPAHKPIAQLLKLLYVQLDDLELSIALEALPSPCAGHVEMVKKAGFQLLVQHREHHYKGNLSALTGLSNLLIHHLKTEPPMLVVQRDKEPYSVSQRGVNGGAKRNFVGRMILNSLRGMESNAVQLPTKIRYTDLKSAYCIQLMRDVCVQLPSIFDFQFIETMDKKIKTVPGSFNQSAQKFWQLEGDQKEDQIAKNSPVIEIQDKEILAQKRSQQAGDFASFQRQLLPNYYKKGCRKGVVKLIAQRLFKAKPELADAFMTMLKALHEGLFLTFKNNCDPKTTVVPDLLKSLNVSHRFFNIDIPQPTESGKRHVYFSKLGKCNTVFGFMVMMAPEIIQAYNELK